MKSLLQFILKYYAAFVFVFFELICIILIVVFNDFHRSSVLNSGNLVVGKINNSWTSVVEYMNLKEENVLLLNENENLINELTQRRAREQDFSYFIKYSPHKYIAAKVVNVTTQKVKNYITINVGKNYGIEPEMAVVGADGIVGIIYRSSEKYSVVIPLINSDLFLSVKLANSEFFGSLHWNARNYRFSTVSEIPGYVNVKEGDTIVTSGYSAIFPQDIPVGLVSELSLNHSTEFYELEIELFTDFRNLQHVYVIKNSDKDEIKLLETSIE